MAGSATIERVCCVLVHGTRVLPFKHAIWTKHGSLLAEYLAKRFPDAHLAEFRWSGAPTQASRQKWACALARQLNDLRREYDRLFVIGHSHGGNVGLAAIQLLRADEICLITLATPFIHLRRSSLPQDARWAAAILLGGMLLIALGLGWLCSNAVRNYFPLYAFFMAGLYATAVLSSGYWIDIVISFLSYLKTRRLSLYCHIQLARPIDVLVLHYGIQDEVNIALTTLRQTTLAAWRATRRHVTKTDLATTNWLARNPNKLPAVLVAMAGLLAALSWLVPAFEIALLALFFVALGLLAFIINYSYAALSVLRTLAWVALSALATLLHGAVSLGHPIDMLGSRVKTSDRPDVSPRYAGNLNVIRLEPDVSSRAKLIFRLLLLKLIHSQILRDPAALETLSNWMAARLAHRKT
jgi:hypothetical protein